MSIIFLRTVFIFIVLFLVMRLMGKRQIGEMQPYELVITLVISELACIPMADPSIPLLYGVITILGIYFLHQLICLIDLAFPKTRTVLSGSPSIVINKSGIDDTQLKKNNLNVTDLIESLRGAGFFALDAVEYALYEASGKFAALPKQDYEKMQNSLPVLLVCEGKFEEKNIALTGREKDYYLAFLKGQGIDEIKKVLIMTIDGNGKIYLQQKGKPYAVHHLNWGERAW